MKVLNRMSTFKNRAGLGLARAKKALVYRVGSPELVQATRKLARQEQELAALRAMLAKRDAGGQVEGIPPENVVWVFGSGRTGSSWLTFMMATLPAHTRWNEPRVGSMFGYLYYEVAWTRQATKHFILANDYEETWLSSLRSLVLSGALTRFPERVEGGYVVIKEPHGSIGAPLLMKALPESRMIFLVRDPRDVVASALAVTLVPKGGRNRASRVRKVEAQAEKYVRQRAKTYLRDIKNTEQAYEAHEGRKVLVRYEDLRADTLETMKRIYSALEIPVDEGDLAKVVEMRTFENIPEEKKGLGTIRRKATPGGWSEDLTPEQVEIIERENAEILNRFYAKS
jgi:hypothetical protein